MNENARKGLHRRAVERKCANSGHVKFFLPKCDQPELFFRQNENSSAIIPWLHDQADCCDGKSGNHNARCKELLEFYNKQN